MVWCSFTWERERLLWTWSPPSLGDEQPRVCLAESCRLGRRQPGVCVGSPAPSGVLFCCSEGHCFARAPEARTESGGLAGLWLLQQLLCAFLSRSLYLEPEGQGRQARGRLHLSALLSGLPAVGTHPGSSFSLDLGPEDIEPPGLQGISILSTCSTAVDTQRCPLPQKPGCGPSSQSRPSQHKRGAQNEGPFALTAVLLPVGYSRC